MTFPWPRAGSDAVVEAGFRTVPDDFVVSEELAFTPCGSGEHLYLRLRKRNLATPELAARLKQAFGVAGSAVGYAGMKDKRAVADQWFSVATPASAEALCALQSGVQCSALGVQPGVQPGDLPGDLPGVELLDASRHGRKLRRGQLRGNRFEIRLTGVGERGWEQGLTRLVAEGAPNYFGPQRFGRDNLQAALAWLPQRRRHRVSRFKQGLYLSVLRSFLFNEVLAARVRAGSWNQVLAGDVLDTDERRRDAAGPLWGRGRTAAQADALALEQAALAPHADVLEGLEHAGLRQDRRSFVLRPHGLRWDRSGADLRVRFELPAGGYATSLLREVFRLREPEAAG